MKQRGRVSAASLEVPASLAIVQRPDAPYDLTDEQVDVWRRVTTAMPADWFTSETFDLLTVYCRHVVAARRIAQLIAQLEGSDEFEAVEYDRLLKMQERESRAMSSLATRMRLTQQTNFNKEKSRKGCASAKKPWEA